VSDVSLSNEVNQRGAVAAVVRSLVAAVAAVWDLADLGRSVTTARETVPLLGAHAQFIWSLLFFLAAAI